MLLLAVHVLAVKFWQSWLLVSNLAVPASFGVFKSAFFTCQCISGRSVHGNSLSPLLAQVALGVERDLLVGDARGRADTAVPGR